MPPALSLRTRCLVVVGLLVVPGASAQVLVRQPTDVTDVRSISYVDANPPRGSAGVALWGSHYQLQPTEDQTLENDTGFSPPAPRRNYQLTGAPTSPGATAIRASIAANLPGRFDLGTIVLGANLAKPARPFASDRKSKYSFVAKIPRSRQRFRFGMVVFDSRGWFYQRSEGFEHAMRDKGTNQPIVHATAAHSNTLLDRGYPTTAFGWQPFADARFYAFVIGAPQVRAAIAMMKSGYPDLAARCSDDPADYEIRHINLNPEIYVPEGSFAQIGMSVTDWRLEIIP